MKLPQIIKRAQDAAGEKEFPAAYAAAREYVEELEGALHDSLKNDVRIREEKENNRLPVR